jgi:FkbM family methyltransferase
MYFPMEGELSVQKLNISKHGFYEKPTSDYLYKNLRKGDLFLDVGVCYGYYSMIAGKKCKQIIGFEPNQDNVKIIRKNIILNKLDNITVFFKALSDKNQIATFYIMTEQGASTFDKVRTTHYDRHISKQVQIEQVKYDDLKLPSPSVIKLDVEGHELEVLRGMKKSLKNTRLVVFECESNKELKEIRKLLKNFKITSIDERNYAAVRK